MTCAPESQAQDGRPHIDAASLPSGVINKPYSFPVQASGGVQPYTWSASGLSQAGLSIGLLTGQITGTPTTAGSFSVRITVTDLLLSEDSADYTLQIDQPLLITTTSLPGGALRTAYSAGLTATGGQQPYSWSLKSGALPSGLTLFSSGAIIGTPTTVGISNFTVQVTDNSQTTEAVLSITITADPLSITTDSLPDGLVGAAYSRNLAAAGGAPPYSWSIASGSLPAGLNLSSSGSITGTPSSPGTAAFTVQAVDSLATKATQPLSITISAATLVITTTSPLPDGNVGIAYSQTLTAQGGVAPYTWAIVFGSLPAGLSLSTSGSITGTPTTIETAGFTVQVTNSGSGGTATKALSLTVKPPPLKITTASPLPDGVVGASYSQDLQASGGVQPYSWLLIAGSLPAGLSLSSSGTIGGTPTTAITATFTVQIDDGGGQTAARTLSVTINPAAVVTPPSITTGSALPSGMTGAPYSIEFSATGGQTPYSWSVAVGPLPPGLSLSAGGLLSGTPQAGGSFSFSIQVRDANGAIGAKVFSVAVQQPLMITTTSPLPNALLGAFYSQQLEASIAGPLAWSILSGSLPDGLQISSSGLINGIPAAVGGFTFTVQVTGGSPVQTASQPFTLDVGAGMVITTPPNLPNGTALAFYTVTLNANGGTPPYHWGVTSGTLPNGLNLSDAGVVSGTPTRVGTFTFTVQVVDSLALKATKIFTISIVSPPLGSFSLVNAPDMLDPAQQIVIGLSISSPQPNAITGALNIAFTSNTDPRVDDPAVLLSNGTRAVSFTIPTGSTVASFPSTVLLLTGTVAGTIRATVDIQNGPIGLTVGSVTVRATPPKITNLSAIRTSSGVKVQVTAYSPDRRVSSAQFSFGVRTGGGVQRVSLSRNVEPDFSAWYAGSPSAAFGSAFVYEQLFTVQGDASTIQDVTVTLTNTQGNGASAPASVTAN